MTVTSFRRQPQVTIERWPTEIPLTAVVTVLAVGLWVMLFVSIIGIVYALGFGVFFFVTHAVLVARIRGSAIRLGPDQMPDLYGRVEELAARFGMERTPEAYLMQAGGVLNAFATRFFMSDMLVLYSELLDACGDNTEARDMIIGHELGHLKEKHVQLNWLRAPALFMPFLGTALSRAREYTCDRYGAAGAGNRDAAIMGLTILASGPKRAAVVNRQQFARQQEDLNTGWMRIGEWLSTHPPLARRIAAIDPALNTGVASPQAGNARALGIMFGFAAMWVVGFVALFQFGGFMQQFQEGMRQAQLQQQQQGRRYPAFTQPPLEGEGSGSMARARADVAELAALADSIHDATGAWPKNTQELYAAWQAGHLGDPPLSDPYSDGLYGYLLTPAGYFISSVGPDGKPGTGDEIIRTSSGIGRVTTRRVPAPGQ